MSSRELDELKQAIKGLMNFARDHEDELDEVQQECLRIATAYIEHGPTPDLVPGKSR
jgi:hypothetical protein